MELIGKLKEQVEKANSKEEVKEAFEQAGLALTDDDIEAISGGAIPIAEGLSQILGDAEAKQKFL